MPKKKVEKDNAERWLLTYSDLMNLLLIFFIILYAMSNVDEAKYQALAESMSEVLGSGGSQKPNILEMESSNDSMIDLGEQARGKEYEKERAKVEAEEKAAAEKAAAEEKKRMSNIQSQVQDLIKQNNLSGFVTVSNEERGLVISITDNILFESGSAVINEGSKGIIQGIANIINQLYANQIGVEGHTDSDYIKNNEFASNWELSAVRATTVTRFLIDNAGIEPDRLFAIGYGEFRPRVPNTTPENKAKNRRVNIVLIDSDYQGSVAPTTTDSGHVIEEKQ